MVPEEVAQKYFAAMRARDLEAVVGLFAGNGAMILPDGEQFAGEEALRELYSRIFSSGAPNPTCVELVSGRNSVATEIETRLPDGTERRTANFFHLDGAGRIARLSVYKRGKW